MKPQFGWMLSPRDVNPWTYRGAEGGGGGSGCQPPYGFSLDDKTSAPEVFCSCSFILRTHFETGLVMVSYYGYEI